jgi:hypothetical protein
MGANNHFVALSTYQALRAKPLFKGEGMLGS